MYLAGEAGVIEINGTVVVELITFLVMLAILARYVYPEVVKLAEARQRAVDEQLKEAEKARTEAEAHLKEAQAKKVAFVGCCSTEARTSTRSLTMAARRC